MGLKLLLRAQVLGGDPIGPVQYFELYCPGVDVVPVNFLHRLTTADIRLRKKLERVCRSRVASPQGTQRRQRSNDLAALGDLHGDPTGHDLFINKILQLRIELGPSLVMLEDKELTFHLAHCPVAPAAIPAHILLRLRLTNLNIEARCVCSGL